MTSVEIQTMNAGTDRQFDRAFITCASGHDLGNVPVEMLDPEDLARPCRRCAREGV